VSSLSKTNIPQNVNEYLTNELRTILKIDSTDNYQLLLTFDNGEIRLYDMSSQLFGVLEILKDINKFKEVFIDSSGNIAWHKDKNIDSDIVWHNKIDICKDAAYLDSIPYQPIEK